MAEKNLIGELDMYREAGIKPNFSDIAKRYGKDRHTVAAYWRAEGGRPREPPQGRAHALEVPDGPHGLEDVPGLPVPVDYAHRASQ